MSKTYTPGFGCVTFWAGRTSTISTGGPDRVVSTVPLAGAADALTAGHADRSAPGSSQQAGSRRASQSSPPYQFEKVVGPSVVRQVRSVTTVCRRRPRR